MGQMKFLILICLSELFGRGFSQTATTPAGVYVPGVCICVTSGYCNLAGGQGSTDGAGLIDPRIMTNGPAAPPITGANNMTMIPQSSGVMPVVNSQTSCAAGLDRCCPPYYSCGISYPPVASAPVPMNGQGQVTYGAFPWHAAILGPNNYYYGGAVVIDHMYVLTAAHKLDNVNVALKVRLGEWDASGQTTEPFPAVEIDVSTIYIHPLYNSRTLQFNIAVLQLSTNVPLGVYPTITNICLPSAPLSNMRCWVSGWGKNDFSGSYQAVMKGVNVPLVDHSTCQAQLQATRLGSSFRLDSNSFVCAGGENANDACIGDGGSPLVCSVGGQWFLQGLVAWGIGCGTANVPGVYVNTLGLTPWIQNVIQQTVGNNVRTTTGPTTPITRTVPTTTMPPTTMPTTTTTSAPTTNGIAFSSIPTTTPRAGSGVNTTTATVASTLAAPATTTTTGVIFSPVTTTTTRASTTAAPATTNGIAFSSVATTTPRAGNGLNTTTAPVASTSAASATTTQPRARNVANSTTTATRTTIRTNATTPKVGGFRTTRRPTTTGV